MWAKEYKKYVLFSQRLALKAGSYLMSRFGNIRKIYYKGKINIVTDADIECERIILNEIKEYFPPHGFISEEAGCHMPRNSELTWLIDPLDGTTNFVHGFPFFAVSIALMRKEQILVGVVYDPVRKEIFSAVRNKGAFLNGKRIKTSTTKRLDHSLLATGFPYGIRKTVNRNIENFKRVIYISMAVRRAGSASLDLCYVAAARFDGFWELDLKPWDTAAGALIVEEAGGRTSSFSGKRYNPFIKEIVASNGHIHRAMLKVLK
jgi:myo-inositol-1(or 4)-monophosphatase